METVQCLVAHVSAGVSAKILHTLEDDIIWSKFAIDIKYNA